jgi:hypothetical protein
MSKEVSVQADNDNHNQRIAGQKGTSFAGYEQRLHDQKTPAVQTDKLKGEFQSIQQKVSTCES